ncbi:MAG: GNAT family N-acetyltransferase [Pseudomonadota bacterium]
MIQPIASARVQSVRSTLARKAAEGSFVMPDCLKTARLVLTRPGPQHQSMALNYFTDPDIAQYLGGVRDKDGAWRTLAMLCGAWDLMGFGTYVIEYDGVGIGLVGFWFPDDWPEIELGYSLRPEHRGQGYVTEAGRAVVDTAWRAGIPSLVSYINPANLPSQRVAKRIGARPAQSVTLSGHFALVFRYPRPSALENAA